MVFIWSYWFNIKDLWYIWQRSDEYSSGLLVPFLAVYVLWSRREQIASCNTKPSLWGLPVFLTAQAMKLFGLFFMYNSMERLSIVISIAALVLLLFGWGLFQKVFTTLVFLCLMLPLPYSIHSSLILPLQGWSTSSAVFCLEMMGYDVVREGNIIDINGTAVAVAEACNGLRMVMAFFVIGSFVVLLIKRAWWEKLVILVSSLPIALLCNTVRLAITAVAFTVLKGEHWEKVFHDFGGYAMMPLAIGIVVFELWLLAKIVTIRTEKRVVSVNK
jgi:exosortase